jgi:hypothetical protein
MTSGEAVKYKSSAHAFAEIVKKEGTKSLFKGAGMCHSHLFYALFIPFFSHHHFVAHFSHHLFQVPTSSVPSQELVCSLVMTSFNSSSLERLTLAVVDNFCFECNTYKKKRNNQSLRSPPRVKVTVTINFFWRENLACNFARYFRDSKPFCCCSARRSLINAHSAQIYHIPSP